MICERSRDRLALALRRYVAGRINNDDLDSVEVDWRDRGAVAVKQMAWNLYDDTNCHYAKGRHAINSDAKAHYRQVDSIPSRRQRISLAGLLVYPNQKLTTQCADLRLVGAPQVRSS